MSFVRNEYRADVERFEYIFDQLEQLKVQEMDRLEESNGAGIGFLDDADDDVDDDEEIHDYDNVMSERMKTDIVRNWLSLVSILLGMILNSSRGICSKHCTNMVSNQPSLSRNHESIPASRLNT